MKLRALDFLRNLVWGLGFDPARWRWFRKLVGGHWERWWIGSPINALLWLEDCEHLERVPLGEERVQCDDFPHPYPAEDAARRLGAP